MQGSWAHAELVQFWRVVEVFITVTRMMMAAAVGAVFRLKRSFDGLGLGAELFEHGLEHVVVEQAQPAVAHLQGHMAIAQVIGGTGQFEGIGAGDVQQLLGTGTDTDNAAILGLQTFAVIQG